MSTCEIMKRFSVSQYMEYLKYFNVKSYTAEQTDLSLYEGGVDLESPEAVSIINSWTAEKQMKMIFLLANGYFRYLLNDLSDFMEWKFADKWLVLFINPLSVMFLSTVFRDYLCNMSSEVRLPFEYLVSKINDWARNCPRFLGEIPHQAMVRCVTFLFKFPRVFAIDYNTTVCDFNEVQMNIIVNILKKGELVYDIPIGKCFYDSDLSFLADKQIVSRTLYIEKDYQAISYFDRLKDVFVFAKKETSVMRIFDQYDSVLENLSNKSKIPYIDWILNNNDCAINKSMSIDEAYYVYLCKYRQKNDDWSADVEWKLAERIIRNTSCKRIYSNWFHIEKHAQSQQNYFMLKILVYTYFESMLNMHPYEPCEWIRKVVKEVNYDKEAEKEFVRAMKGKYFKECYDKKGMYLLIWKWK